MLTDQGKGRWLLDIAMKVTVKIKFVFCKPSCESMTFNLLMGNGDAEQADHEPALWFLN